MVSLQIHFPFSRIRTSLTHKFSSPRGNLVSWHWQCFLRTLFDVPARQIFYFFESFFPKIRIYVNNRNNVIVTDSDLKLQLARNGKEILTIRESSSINSRIMGNDQFSASGDFQLRRIVFGNPLCSRFRTSKEQRKGEKKQERKEKRKRKKIRSWYQEADNEERGQALSLCACTPLEVG